MKPYTKYKPTGIEWIGNIPEHWDRIKLKLAVSTKICDGPHETPEWTLEGIPFLSAESIKGNKLDFNYKRGYISKEQHEIYCQKSKVIKGDILFCKSGSTTGKSALVDFDDDFGIWSPLAIIRTNNRVFNTYMFQFIQSIPFRLQVETAWTFGTQPNIGMGALENLWIALPSLPEQTHIANFLDRKTAELDTLIANKKSLIELLKEERTAIINHAITKGINPNVKYKDSGIEWIGEIPEHWEVSKLKLYCSKITDGSHVSPISVDYGKRYISVKDVGQNFIDFENCKKISQPDFEILQRNGCQPKFGDILLTKDGTIGRATIVNDDNDYVVLSSLGIISPNFEKISSEYLREYLVSDLNVKQMLSLIQGSALTRITIT